MSKNTCSHCGCTLEEGATYPFKGELYCADCLEELTTFCHHCGTRIYRDSAEGDGRIVLCDHCYNNHYIACDRCGRLIYNEDACYESDDDDVPYCHNCFQEIFRIHSYNYKPEPIFYGEGTRYFGVELEVDEGGEIGKNAKAVADVANAEDEHIYCKHDGSLNTGFEIVTHPMTVDYHLNHMPWALMLQELKSMGYRSHQTSTCGLHVHVNRDSLGDTYEEQDETIGRILFFVEKHWEELVKFSRRTIRQLERWAARYGLKECPQEILKTAKGGYGRYTSVNLCNQDTIEFRFFRGTLKYNSVIAALQLVNQICNVAFCMSDAEIKDLSWTSFVAMCNQPELIQYLKERRLYINEPVESEVDL